MGYSQSERINDSIPCLFVRATKKDPSKILVYFHGNAEDLGKSWKMMIYLSRKLECHCIAMEYPGYGVYEGKPSETTLLRDGARVMEFIEKVLDWPQE
jgi:hypothetical protein